MMRTYTTSGWLRTAGYSCNYSETTPIVKAHISDSWGGGATDLAYTCLLRVATQGCRLEATQKPMLT